MSRFPKIDSRGLLVPAAIALATALTVAAPAFAADTTAGTAPAPTPHHASRNDSEPVTGTQIKKTEPTNLETIKVYGGAVLRPGDAQWADNDTSAPELPMVRDQ